MSVLSPHVQAIMQGSAVGILQEHDGNGFRIFANPIKSHDILMAYLSQTLDLSRIILFGFGIPEYFHRNLFSATVFLRPNCLKDIAKASESEFLSDWNSNSIIMY